VDEGKATQPPEAVGLGLQVWEATADGGLAARAHALEASERLNAQIVSSLQEGVIVVDRDDRITRTNAAAAELCGVSLGELTGLRLRELPVVVRHPDGRPATTGESPAHRALQGETVRGVLLSVRRRDGSEIWVEVNSRPLDEPDGSRFGALSTYADVSERIHRERRMRQEADSDPLTGLANRRALERALAAALGRARVEEREVAVLMVDLDGFKALNDAYGHIAGDAALREVARRLVACVRERDVVARVGGDEFVLVLPDLHPGHGTAEECARRVRAALADPIGLDHASPRLGAATGVACFPRDGADGVALLAHADRAMYRAKR
jgi:diguanylate cyclase (GGDEF)-like protein/PAS domain S-box-containing protein